jgi:replicative DNA helicase
MIDEADCIELPACLDSERSTLGAILLNGSCYAEAAQLLKADDFFLDSHRRIFRTITRLAENGEVIDLLTVTVALRDARELDAIGGPEYVSSLIDGVPDGPTISAYARRVKEKSLARRLIYAANAAVARAMDGEPAREIAASLMESVLDVGADNQRKHLTGMRELMPEVLRELETESHAGAMVGLPSGLGALDRMTGGFRRGELIVIGALPGRGKTAFGCQIIAANAETKTATGVFSVEMSRSDIGRRLLAATGTISAVKIRNPHMMAPHEWPKLAESAAEIGSWPVWLDDTGNLSVADLVTRAKILVSRKGIKLLIVDHLQLVQAESRDVRDRVSKVAEACRQIAKSEQIVVVLLSQLRRPQNSNDIPTMLDLKESGDIEAAAHVVLLLHSPESQDGSPTGEDLVIISKNRNGAKGPIPVRFNRSDLRFYARETV